MVKMSSSTFYELVPEIGLYMARRAVNNPGQGLTWFEAKIFVQREGLVMPRNREWFRALEYFEAQHPDIAADMLSLEVPVEMTDSLIAWPDPDTGQYSSRINPRPQTGRYPLLIERATVSVEDIGGSGFYRLHGGERTELPYFPAPNQRVRLERPIKELGLPEGAVVETTSNSRGDPTEGLRCVTRYKEADPGQVAVHAKLKPTGYAEFLGFRPAIAGSTEHVWRLLKQQARLN